MGLRIGYDAKRYFNNATGLGNYSRTLIDHLDACHPDNQYVLFVHKKYQSKGFNRFKVVRGSGQPMLWRSYGICKDIGAADISIFHGLSGELPFRRSGNVRYIVTIHDIMFRIFPQWYKGFDRMFYNEKLRRAVLDADAVVAISKQTRDDLLEHTDVDPKKLSVIYQSWNPAYDEQQLDMVHVPLLPADYLLFVGSFYERKNLQNVIWAISDPRCRDIPLVVVGNGKPRYKQMIRELIDAQRVERQILILEDVYDELLKQLYIRARAVIYPSLYEGFGLPVLEAMRCGKPVITSNSSSLKEVGAKGALLLQDPCDRDEMSQAILDLFNDTVLYERLQNEIPGHIAQFSPVQTSAKWNDLYHSLV